ncbi:MAG: formate dehydrogenase subunit delta [Aestuariivirga sp.]
METRDMLRMANQIADFFRSYPHDEAVKEAATHLNSFWDPRMRKHLFEHLAKGGEGLDPLIIEAAAQIRKPKMDAA